MNVPNRANCDCTAEIAVRFRPGGVLQLSCGTLPSATEWQAGSKASARPAQACGTNSRIARLISEPEVRSSPPQKIPMPMPASAGGPFACEVRRKVGDIIICASPVTTTVSPMEAAVATDLARKERIR